MKFTIEMSVHELARSIQAGTLEALVKDVQAHEDEVRKTTPVTKSTPKVTETKEKTTEPESKVTDLEKDGPPVEDPPQITIEQVRAAFIAKNSNKNNTPKLKAILDRFGVRKVTDLDEKDFPEVLKALEEI